MKKKYFTRNLIKILLPVLFPLLILGGFSISITQTSIKDGISESNVTTLRQVRETIELMFSELDSLSLNFYLNAPLISKFKEFLEGAGVDDFSMEYEDIETMNTFLNIITPPVNSKPYIHSVYVYYRNSHQNFLISNRGIENISGFLDKGWLKSYQLHNGNDTWIEVRSIRNFEFETHETQLISIYKNLYSPGSTRADGVVVLNIKLANIENLLNAYSSSSQQSLMLLDKNDSVIAGGHNLPIVMEDITLKELNRNTRGFFSYDSGRNTYTISQVPSERYALKYLSIIPSRELYKLPITLSCVTILLLIVSLLLSLVLAYHNTKKNHDNLMVIFSTFDAAVNGAPLPELPPKVRDEYAYIQQNLINTFIEKNYLTMQLSEKKYKLRAIELLALQSQINPHFLFNTLKTIFWKSIDLTGELNEVSRMVEYLTDILQYSLSSPERPVMLHEEIKNTQSYIEIQKIRYKDKFGVIWQYSDDVLGCNVLKLLFQPFIENSIYHGIKEKVGRSFIKIKIKLADNLLKITIIDDGAGIERKKLISIRQRLADSIENEENQEHIGLFNTNKRLGLTYGNKYGIWINSKRGLGTVIYINIPVYPEPPVG